MCTGGQSAVVGTFVTTMRKITSVKMQFGVGKPMCGLCSFKVDLQKIMETIEFQTICLYQYNIIVDDFFI